MRLRLSAVFFLLALRLFPCLSACAEDERIEPAWPVPDYVEHLLQVASEEVGYKEDHGRTKYGAWAGDAAARESAALLRAFCLLKCCGLESDLVFFISGRGSSPPCSIAAVLSAILVLQSISTGILSWSHEATVLFNIFSARS